MITQKQIANRMRLFRTAVMVPVLLAGCGDDLLVPDYNNPSLEELQNPSPAIIAAAATGMLVGMRDEFDDRNGYISLVGIVGRESYNFDGADPRFITEMLEGQLNPSSPAFGGNLWIDRYRNIRHATITLEGLEKVAAFSTAQKEATRGYLKTLQAHELLLVVNTRDVNGVALDLNRVPTEAPARLSTRAEGLTRVAQLLDEARTHLQAGGAAFPFPLSSGFTGFNTPATFLRFNRALKARVEVYRAQYASALTALNESFLTLDATQLNVGAFHVFTTGAGDDVNELFDPRPAPDILAHPSIVTDADRRTNGELDLRVQRKIRNVTSRTVSFITTDKGFAHYGSLNAPIPIIRNEELILLRAEANIGLGNAAAALTDINFVRTNSGGLAALTQASQATLTELLKQKRYSLLFEGHRWIDLRRYNRLNDLPLDRSNHTRNAAFPIPEAECLAREKEAPCSVANGA
ncbi:MAG: RagB/SusD family nutrient uptake outer membrane protein [Longimicrobiales bacterium]